MALDAIIKDGNRAGDVVGRIRALIQKVPPRHDQLDINGAILEVVEVTRSATDHRPTDPVGFPSTFSTESTVTVTPVTGDRKREPKADTGEKKSRKPKEPAVKLDFTGQEPLGKCPRCGGQVFEADSAYVCEKSQADKKPCKFRSGKVVLQQPVDREQITKLLAAGRTDLLNKFISKSGRPFAAYLVVDEAGKVGFEFASPETNGPAQKAHYQAAGVGLEPTDRLATVSGSGCASVCGI